MPFNFYLTKKFNFLKAEHTITLPNRQFTNPFIMRKNILSFLAVIYFISCNPVPRDVRDALEQAGDNRAELQKVIDHYSKAPADSLKLKAAYFLIKHMPGH